MIDVATALPLVHFHDRDDVYHTCRTLLVSRAEDIPIFDRAFAAFFARLGATTRPKYAYPFSEYLENDWKFIEQAIKDENWDAFKTAFDKAIESANAWHEENDKPYIKWKLPSTPPQDLDLTPRKKS